MLPVAWLSSSVSSKTRRAASVSVSKNWLRPNSQVMMLRKKEPHAERPYKMPWGPVIPILALEGTIPTFAISLMILTPGARIVFVVWIVIGILYYLIFRRKQA